MAKRINPDEYIGKKYGRLTVVEFVGRNKYSNVLYRCMCDCGEECVAVFTKLKGGYTKSCGCLRMEMLSKYRITTHRDCSSRLYSIWTKMKARCHRESDWSYKNYGARGIVVCEEWRSSYESFREWALNNGYADSLSIDRIDVNGNYEPGNCRWATMKEQARNKRSNHYITYNGETASIAEWADRVGLAYVTLYNRVAKGDWSAERALTTPVKQQKKRSEHAS